jgi:hypothetical protein
MNRWRQNLFDLCVWVGVTWACYHVFRNQGYEAEWYPLEPVIDFTADPPFRHRLLMALPARLLMETVAGLSVLYAFLLTQLIAIALAVGVMMVWSRLFIHRALVGLGPLLMLAMLAPTFHYFTYYDVAVVLFSAACLTCLLHGWLPLYLLIFFVGTFNHEIMLVLVLDAAVILWAEGMEPRRVAAFVVINLLTYVLARAILFGLLPVETAWNAGKSAANVEILLHHPKNMLKVVLTVGCWLAAAAIGWRHAPKMLRLAAAVHLPQLVVIDWLFGQINESRMFNNFVPLAVALVLCFVHHQLDALPGPKRRFRSRRAAEAG